MGQSSVKAASVEPATTLNAKVNNLKPLLPSTNESTTSHDRNSATITATAILRDPETGRPLDKDGKPLKPCCSCPDTKKLRDECMLRTGDEQACSKEIEAHKACLRALGFKI